MGWVYVIFIAALLGFVVGWDFGVAWGIGVGLGGLAFFVALRIWFLRWTGRHAAESAAETREAEALLERRIEAMTPEARRLRALALLEAQEPTLAQGEPPALLVRAPEPVREVLGRWSQAPIDNLGGWLSWEFVDEHLDGRLVIGRLHDGEPILADLNTGAVGIQWNGSTEEDQDDEWDAEPDLWRFLLHELDDPAAGGG
ncbi:MAG: hypothetical protein AAF138_07455 [Planctomycetota bacterium]